MIAYRKFQMGPDGQLFFTPTGENNPQAREQPTYRHDHSATFLFCILHRQTFLSTSTSPALLGGTYPSLMTRTPQEWG